MQKFIHVQQGMAYAALANTDYSVGLYTAIFPVFVYLFFGPSRHISFGTNPLTSMIVGTSHLSKGVKSTHNVGVNCSLQIPI